MIDINELKARQAEMLDPLTALKDSEQISPQEMAIGEPSPIIWREDGSVELITGNDMFLRMNRPGNTATIVAPRLNIIVSELNINTATRFAWNGYALDPSILRTTFLTPPTDDPGRKRLASKLSTKSPAPQELLDELAKKGFALHHGDVI